MQQAPPQKNPLTTFISSSAKDSWKKILSGQEKNTEYFSHHFWQIYSCNLIFYWNCKQAILK